MLALSLIAGCQTMTPFLGTSTPAKQAEGQTENEVSPALRRTVCNTLGGPIKYSRNDTRDTIDQVKVLHNSQWVEFKCEDLK